MENESNDSAIKEKKELLRELFRLKQENEKLNECLDQIKRMVSL